MPKPIYWSPLSERDFESIIDYLKTNWGNKVVLKFIEITEEMINQISINSRQFPVIHKKKRVRKCVITKHNTLFYRDYKSIIHILRIFDTRQNPGKMSYK